MVKKIEKNIAISSAPPAITVIIALYKGESTMSRMADCVLAQSFQDFELILVDDGSPDRSGEIADKYAAKDNRIKVIHKENEGLAMARNDALRIARGKYSIQFDQDDWVSQDCLEELYHMAESENADMVICDYFHNDEYRQTYCKQAPTSLDHWSVLEDIVTGKLFGYCWNKLIKNSVYRDYNVIYPKEFYGCEDQYGMCQMLKHNIKIAYLPKAYYHYIYVTGSLSRYYDGNTYQNDIVCRDMFFFLLKDTPSMDSAYNAKSFSILGRAFLFGRNVYTSREFKKRFYSYKCYIQGGMLESFLYWLSLHGMYHLARSVFGFLFLMKQKYKKMFYR